MPNVMDVRNWGISFSISQITTKIINAKEKYIVNMAQVCFKLLLFLHKINIKIILLALEFYVILIPMSV